MLKSKSFKRLWIGQSAANLGDILYIVSLITILYAKTGSALYLTLLPFLNMLGRFISSFFAPLLLNRVPLKKLLYDSQLYKTILLFMLCLVVNLQNSPIIWFILMCIFLIAFLDGWAMPAMNAMLPRLVPQIELTKANSFVATLYDSIQLSGWAIGGIIVAFAGSKSVIWLTLILYILSTIMMKMIHDPTAFEKREKDSSKLDELKEGWQVVWKNPLYRTIHVVITFEAIANVVWVAAILYVFVEEVLHVSEAWWGYLNTAFFIGMIAAGFVSAKWSEVFNRYIRFILIIASSGTALVTLFFGLSTFAWLALILTVLSGFIEQVKGIAMNLYLQNEATTMELPKIYSVQNVIVSVAFGLSTLFFGVITVYFNVQVTFVSASILLIFSAGYLISCKERFSIYFKEEKSF